MGRVVALAQTQYVGHAEALTARVNVTPMATMRRQQSELIARDGSLGSHE
jgi:hypothetical protein